MRGALTATGITREEYLCRAYADAAATHNRLRLTAPLDATPRFFHDRPFRVLDAGRFALALLARVTDPAVAALPPVGAIDQFADNTLLLGDVARCRAAVSAVLAAPVAY